MAKQIRLVAAAAIAAAVVTLGQSASAQYFGQNKVQYRTFDFQVLSTEHFDIYYYPEFEAAARDASRMAERWYARLSKVLDHQLSGRQPLILYASHPHFLQTNVIEALLGEGVGGVTEGFRRRIVMPVGAGYAETDHVLGHELVHAFQYDILGRNMNLPLWFIEGMAEYLSIGSVDPHTAVWLRDAALSEQLPTVRNLGHPRYFPYRFGHAFWAYVGGRWGDTAVADVLHAARPRGGQGAMGAGDPVAILEQVLGVDHEAISQGWHDSILSTMVRPLGDRDTAAGRRIIEPGHRNELNIGPVLSPDGSRMAFLSSRDRISIDLFVADAATGQVQRRLLSTAADPHYDSLQFISSAGSWDPTGRQLAVAAIRRGRPALAIIDAISGGRQRDIDLPNIDEVFHPAWSPDGTRIAFSGLSAGVSDLWVLDLASGAMQRLTDDAFADLQPEWSPDGRQLVFSTDRYTTQLDALRMGQYELATIDVATRRTVRVRTFEGARHHSPRWTRDGSIYFIANPDGVPDVYRLASEGARPTRITRLMTGATGITAASPALAAAADGSRLAVVVYRNLTYEIQAIEGDALRAETAAPTQVTLAAGQLAPGTRRDDEVDRLLGQPTVGLPGPRQQAEMQPYRPRLALDYIGQEFGVATNSAMGAYVGGGIAMSFSDMLGDHVVRAAAQINGGLDDLGGQVGYINRTRRWNWGGFVEQIPYVTGGVIASVQNIGGQRVLVEQLLRDRQVDRRVMGLVAYPFSRAARFEAGASVRHLSFNRHLDTRGFALTTGALLFEDSTRTPLGDPITLGEVSMALVRDTSLFGATGPILGHRSRVEVSPAWGDLRFTNLVADGRHYLMPFRPLTIASRLLHVGRYGADSESPMLSPLFIGFPNLVRGYDIGSFDQRDCQFGLVQECSAIGQFIGSRVLVAGVELRAPIVGLFTGNIEYGFIPADLIAFFDAGVAWDQNSRPEGFGDGTRPWARSYGAGVRVNALGYLVVELAAARALDRPQDGWRFVFGIRPGF
jgi:Tol biopolymer transport system component